MTIGILDPDVIYHGSTPVDAVHHGTALVWSSAPTEPDRPLNFVFEGDSITGNALDGTNWPTEFVALLTADGLDVEFTNKAVAGSTMASHPPWPYVNGRAQAVDALLDPDRDNFLFLLIGYNDTAANTFETLGSLQGLVAAYIAARGAAGWTVVLVTQGAWWWGKDAARVTYNAWLRSQADRIVSFDTNPEIGTHGSYIYPWTPDRVHPSGDGSRVMAKCALMSWRLPSVRTTVASFTPVQGLAGTEVTIHGVGFTGATAVTFGGSAATSFAIESDTEIVAEVAATTSGPVTVTSPTGVDVSNLTYSYSATPQATITEFTPTSAFPTATVTITGTTLSTVDHASFTGANGSRVSPTFTVVASDTVVRLGVPQAAVAGPIVLGTPANGTATSPTDFTPDPAAPAITGFASASDGSGYTAGVWVGQQPYVFGTGLTPSPVSSSFTGGTWPVAHVSSPTLALMNAVAPGMVSGDLTITTRNGTSAPFPVPVIAQPPPAIASFTPGSAQPDTQIVVAGYAFLGTVAAGVKVNGTACAPGDLIQVLDSRIIFKVPVGATTGPIEITSGSGTVTSSTNLTVS